MRNCVSVIALKLPAWSAQGESAPAFFLVWGVAVGSVVVGTSISPWCEIEAYSVGNTSVVRRSLYPFDQATDDAHVDCGMPPFTAHAAPGTYGRLNAGRSPMADGSRWTPASHRMTRRFRSIPGRKRQEQHRGAYRRSMPCGEIAPSGSDGVSGQRTARQTPQEQPPGMAPGAPHPQIVVRFLLSSLLKNRFSGVARASSRRKRPASPVPMSQPGQNHRQDGGAAVFRQAVRRPFNRQGPAQDGTIAAARAGGRRLHSRPA